jgi:hypothetical protein
MPILFAERQYDFLSRPNRSFTKYALSSFTGPPNRAAASTRVGARKESSCFSPRLASDGACRFRHGTWIESADLILLR